MAESSKSIYIRNTQASKIYEAMNRESEFDCAYDGSVAYSLETIKLKELGLKVKTNKKSERQTSNDIINVKFSWKVKSYKDIAKLIEKKIVKITLSLDNEETPEEEIESKLEYIENLKLKKEEILTHIDWYEVKANDLRTLFYNEGFILDGVQYVFFGRSGSKSRTGQALYIKKSLAKKIILWCRMGIKKLMKKGIKVDLAGLLAYEKLVGSAIESIVNIPTSKMLMISDVDSIFEKECNVIRTDPETGLLRSYREMAFVKNSLFDGQLLLAMKYFKKGKSMMLLRNHFFKSAAFNTNIQEALRFLCPDGQDYDTWELEDMFGNKILAKDVELIMSPTSLKALKFSKFVGDGSQSGMYDYWRELVKSEGCRFGVVKNEKASKRGDNIQQTSYQMVNSMPFTKEDIKELTIYEKDYISKLKNDDDFFSEYLLKNKDIMNSNEVFAEMYKANNNIVGTKVFKNYRTSKIKSFVQHVKKGKFRLKGDYVVMVGNPYEELLHAVGMLPVVNGVINPDYEGILKHNEINTILFEENKELTGFRNPHTSSSNVLVSVNKHLEEYKRFFNFSKNIAAVNSINFEIQDILSGSDFDSDTLALFDHEILLRVAKKCFSEYKVCINAVESDKVQYRLTSLDMAIIDNKLAKSQRLIGEVVNLGQQAMSNYWDKIANNGSSYDISVLLNKVDVMTVLSGICIDLAKKFYAIDIEKEVKEVREIDQIDKKKPMFWRCVSETKFKKGTLRGFDTPMDYLTLEMSKLDYAYRKDSIEFESIMNVVDLRNSNHKQIQKLIEYVNTLSNRLFSISSNRALTKKESYEKSIDTIRYYGYELNKIAIKKETMYSLIKTTTTKDSDVGVNNIAMMLKTLYDNNSEMFLDIIRE